MYEWRTCRNCVFKNNIHLVFVTKYRRNVFSGEIIDRIKEIFIETCKQMNVDLIEFGGEDDHVHLLVDVPPKIAISNLVGKLKGKSAYFLKKVYYEQLKKKLWGKHLWSPSYCAVSCGGAPLSIVKKYIENQRKPPSLKQAEHSSKLRKKYN